MGGAKGDGGGGGGELRREDSPPELVLLLPEVQDGRLQLRLKTRVLLHSLPELPLPLLLAPLLLGYQQLQLRRLTGL